ncbi:putative reverse transcriptase domain, ribonuclease H-like domain protein [Tanacetum coccineum]
MASQVIKETVSKDQRNPPGITTEDKKTKTGSPPIEGRTTACSPICPKVQEKFLPQKEPQKASNHLPRFSEANDHEIPPNTVISMKITDTIPMIAETSKEDYAAKNTISESMACKEEITFPPVTRVSNTPVIIEAVVFERKVGRVYMNSGSTCEKIGIVVSTIHGAIKFHTKKRVGTVLSVGEAGEEMKKAIRTLTISKERIPSCDDNIQSLNGKVAALIRFLSKGTERSLPFFKVLKSCKGKKKIHWTDEADKAFKEIKKFVQALPMLTSPRAGETLTMYLVASKESINAALFTKRSEGQIPIYFVSRVLQGAKLNYPTLEKLILALVHAARRLRRYFQAHTIMVPTGTSIKQALTGLEKTGRVAKWAIKLGEHDIIFLKRDEREIQVDFLPEIPFNDSEKKVKKYTYALRFEFETTNNKAAYEALLAGLRIAQEMEIMKVAIFLDSEAAKAIQDCDKCKEQSAIKKAVADGAIAVRSTWPFSHWGIHILGPLPMALGGLQFLVIAIRSTPDDQLERRKTLQRGDIRRIP